MQWLYFALGALCVPVQAAAPNFVAAVTLDKLPLYKLDVSEPRTINVDKVKQYSGYLTVRPDTSSFFGGKRDDRLFFWLFESRNDPRTDPVVLWLNGGPGCSSMQAILFENGPSTLSDNNVVTPNPYSWNNNATIIYLDQPLNVGYSVGTDKVRTTQQAAEDVYSFLTLLFKQFPEYADLPFHIAGESYAGRYIPVIAERIMKSNNRPISVESILLGNGLVDVVAQFSSYYPMLCGQGGYKQVLDPQVCAKMQKDLPQCISDMQSCVDYGQRSSCFKSSGSCSSQYQFGKLNPYDIRTPCPQTRTNMCYKGLDNVQDFFDSPSVKTGLGVDQGLSYQVCSTNFNGGFDRWDRYESTKQNVTRLLEKGVRTLVYSGDKDIIVNWLSGQQWTRDLSWSGHTQFVDAIKSPKNWTVAGRPAGQVSQVGALTFLRVYDAGHMVPHDQPAAALDMFNRWIHNQGSFEDLSPPADDDQSGSGWSDWGWQDDPWDDTPITVTVTATRPRYSRPVTTVTVHPY